MLTDIKARQLKQVAESLVEAKPVVIEADLTDSSATAEIVPTALEATGRLDMLASVAGYAARGSILDTTVEAWDRMTDLNLRAHFQLIQAVARNLVERDVPGSIVCAGSLNAYGGQPDLCAYSSAKGGLQTLVKHAAYALLPHRIRVNVVNFGWMRTQGEIDLHSQLYGRSEFWIDDAAAELPFGKLIQPEEAARLLIYLLSDDSSVMTGSSIDFDQSVPGSGPTTATRSDKLPTYRS